MRNRMSHNRNSIQDFEGKQKLLSASTLGNHIYIQIYTKVDRSIDVDQTCLRLLTVLEPPSRQSKNTTEVKKDKQRHRAGYGNHNRRLDLLQPFGMRWTHHSATSGIAGPPKSNDIHRMPRQPRQLAPTGSVAQGMLQHRAGVGNFQKVDVLRLELDEGGLGQADVDDGEESALLDEEVLHHPKGDEAGALLGGEFQHAAVRLGALLGVLETEEHGIVHLESGQGVKGRRR